MLKKLILMLSLCFVISNVECNDAQYKSLKKQTQLWTLIGTAFVPISCTLSVSGMLAATAVTGGLSLVSIGFAGYYANKFHDSSVQSKRLAVQKNLSLPNSILSGIVIGSMAVGVVLGYKKFAGNVCVQR